jgi:hypothetical protein
MLCEMPADFLDAGNEAGRRIAAAKVILDGRRNRVPHRLTERIVCPGVAAQALSSAHDDAARDVPRFEPPP